ncbi:MAG TPA: NAD(P)-binding domain-containing protein [Candidatus Limnocylindria bacterium]|nr:NAD(P)-binding domain-containing protein [Candidatus Limnocylindria bacterium]
MDRNRLETIVRLAAEADAALATPGQDAADAALVAAGDDVATALQRLIESDSATALVLAGQLSGFWQDAGLVEQGRTLTQRALRAGADADAAEGVHTAAVARATLVAADLAFRQGDQEGTTANARTAIDLAAAAGDRRTAGLAWLDLARVAYREGDASGIETASLAAGKAAPDDPLVTRGVLHMQAWAAHTAGDLEQARRRFEASLALRRAHGGALGIASELANLGDLAMDSGDPGAAARWFSDALTAARDLDSAYFLVNTLPSLAALAAADDPEVAARLFGAADAASRRSGLLPDPGADRVEARAALRDSMSPRRFEELLHEGSSLTARDAAALADRIADAGAPRARPRTVDTVVVGAGQAGLVMSRLLADAGREHVVLDRRASLGGGWQDRWDAFRLVSPNWTVSVPGLDYQGADPDSFMPRDEIIAHWRRYAEVIAAPVELDTDVTRLVALDGGPARFRLTTSRGTIDAGNVVVAGGPFQVPHVPAIASGLAPSIRQLHAHHYRRPEDLPPGRILLVGSGQTGVQLAEELQASGREVILSVGRCGSVPRRYRGHDIFWWLRQMATSGRELGAGLPTPADLPSPAARFACNPQLSGHGGGHSVSLRRMAADGIRLVGRLQMAEGTTARFASDLQENVIMAASFFEGKFRPGIEAFIDRVGEQFPMDEPDPGGSDPVQLPDVPDVAELDLAAEGVSTVIWTSGYRPAFDWIEPPVLDEFGLPVGAGGVTPVDGLTFIGQPWMVDMVSANLVGLVRDAEALAARW